MQNRDFGIPTIFGKKCEYEATGNSAGLPALLIIAAWTLFQRSCGFVLIRVGATSFSSKALAAVRKTAGRRIFLLAGSVILLCWVLLSTSYPWYLELRLSSLVHSMRFLLVLFHWVQNGFSLVWWLEYLIQGIFACIFLVLVLALVPHTGVSLLEVVDVRQLMRTYLIAVFISTTAQSKFIHFPKQYFQFI